MQVLEFKRRWRKPLIDPLPVGLFEILCTRDQDRLDRWVIGAGHDELRHVFGALASRSWAVIGGRGPLYNALARHSSLIPGMLVVKVRLSPELIPRFLRNPHLSDVHVTIARSKVRNGLLDSSWPIDLVRRSLDALYQRGEALPHEALHQILRAYEHAKWSEQGSNSRMRFQTAPGRRALEVLAILPEVNESNIRYILTTEDCPADLVSRFVCHPNSGPNIWRLLLNNTGGVTFEAAAPALAHHPPALELEDVRERLLGSREPEVLAGLLKCGVDPSSVFGRLVGVSRRAAVRALVAAPLEVRRSIAAEQLLPLLRADDPRIRADGLLLLGTVGREGRP